MRRFGNKLEDARSRAAEYETSLEPGRRKRLGQFFTGLPLGRLLAAVALDPEASTVIDPMSGHGDLLDAVIEHAARRGQALTRIEGVEIDPHTAAMCRERLGSWGERCGEDAVTIRQGDAFDPAVARGYRSDGYDLVITNPPYVRYQSLADRNGREHLRSPDEIRRDLLKIVLARVPSPEARIWRALIEGYSGLADLSVPSWILAASLVRPGGVLALVVPATWRSRDYGDVVEYLLVRCFRLEFLIEDTQPGWFSDALVRTQLVIARRHASEETRTSAVQRASDERVVHTISIAPEASANGSLVGAAFPGPDPERQFAQWLCVPASVRDDSKRGIERSRLSMFAMIQDLLSTAQERDWFRALEPTALPGSLFMRTEDESDRGLVPDALRGLLSDFATVRIVTPYDSGIRISQGLRTGCNGFFYVDLVAELPKGAARVRLSELFGGEEIIVPATILVPVVRRQSEVSGPVAKETLKGRALDLTDWALPEDAERVAAAASLYEREGRTLPRVMPAELAAFVRRAANTGYGTDENAKPIPALSAVKTNVREPGNGRSPRFWYMLPPFTRRHLPDVFVARVNQGIPWVEANDDPPVLIDANFSTIWAEAAGWTPLALRALLNSSWCRACMEAIGTPLGGGALKLEATHLKRLPLPELNAADLARLDAEGRVMSEGNVPESVDRLVLERITGLDGSSNKAAELIEALRTLAADLCERRQRRRT